MATYPTDAGLTDRKPDRGIRSGITFKNASYDSQAGYRKSRNISRRRFEEFDIEYSYITGTQKDLIKNFYEARYGEHESFTFDLTHINETGLITVAFKGDLSIERVQQRATEANSIYTVKFKITTDY